MSQRPKDHFSWYWYTHHDPNRLMRFDYTSSDLNRWLAATRVIWHAYEWVMAHVWMSHGTHINESWQTWMSHGTFCDSCGYAIMLQWEKHPFYRYCSVVYIRFFYFRLDDAGFMHVPWLIYCSFMTRPYVFQDSCICAMLLWYTCHDSFTHASWRIHMCAMTDSYVCHDSFICVTSLIHMCAMTHSYVCRDSFIYVPWLVQMCDMTPWGDTRSRDRTSHPWVL